MPPFPGGQDELIRRLLGLKGELPLRLQAEKPEHPGLLKGVEALLGCAFDPGHGDAHQGFGLLEAVGKAQSLCAREDHRVRLLGDEVFPEDPQGMVRGAVDQIGPRGLERLGQTGVVEGGEEGGVYGKAQVPGKRMGG